MGAPGNGSRSAVGTDTVHSARDPVGEGGPKPVLGTPGPRGEQAPRAPASSAPAAQAAPPPPRPAPSPPRLGPQTAPGGGANGSEEGGSGLVAHRDFPRRARPDKDPQPGRRWRMRLRPRAATAGSLAPCR